MSVQCHANNKVSIGPSAAEDGSQTENTNDLQNALRPRPGLRAPHCTSPPCAREHHTRSTWTWRRCEISSLPHWDTISLPAACSRCCESDWRSVTVDLLLLLLSVHERLQLLLEGAQLFVSLSLDLAGACPRTLQLFLPRGLVLELLGARLGRVGRPLQSGVLARHEGS